MSENLTAIDLFCGGGGFSEGFRQAGFEITHAVDYDEGACETYRLNVPENQDTDVLKRDILNDISPSDLPSDIDVLIGSPPCREFSRSKNGGGGDHEKGKNPVRRFFEFVDELQPDYWLMENVPNSQSAVEEAFEESDLSDREDVDAKPITLDADKFATPQRRTRLFFGDFPVPDPERYEDGLDLAEVINHFPNPIQEPPANEIQDPLHPDALSLVGSDLTDHFYDSFLTEREAHEVRLKKEDHSYYGRMSFPDETGKPSRTILASRRKMARETMVVEQENDLSNRSPYRELTVREAATIQGFPISYQFEGSSLSQKWRRVGDAVPPTLSYRIALAIREADGEDVSNISPNISKEVPEVEYRLDVEGTRARRRQPITRVFQHHVPYDDKRKFRVDLANEKENPPAHPLTAVMGEDFTHPVRFKAILTKGYASNHETREISLDEARLLVGGLLMEQEELRSKVAEFNNRLTEEIAPDVPDATTLQAKRSRRAEDGDEELIEYNLLDSISGGADGTKSGLVDEVFPYGEFKNQTVHYPSLFQGTHLPVRVVMKLLAVNYIAYSLNYCGWWIENNPEDVYLPEDASMDNSDIPENIPCSSDAPFAPCVRELFASWGEAAGTSKQTPLPHQTD